MTHGKPHTGRFVAYYRVSTQRQEQTLAAHVAPIIREIQNARLSSLQGVAGALNERGIRTRRGRQWNASQVRNVLDRTG